MNHSRIGTSFPLTSTASPTSLNYTPPRAKDPPEPVAECMTKEEYDVEFAKEVSLGQKAIGEQLQECSGSEVDLQKETDVLDSKQDDEPITQMMEDVTSDADTIINSDVLVDESGAVSNLTFPTNYAESAKQEVEAQKAPAAPTKAESDDKTVSTSRKMRLRSAKKKDEDQHGM